MAALLAQKIISLFVIIFTGFLLVKTKILTSKDTRPLSAALLYAIVPCSVFNAFVMDRTPEILQGILAAAAAAVLIHAIMLVVTGLIRKPLSFTPIEINSIVYSNSGNLIIPLVTALLGGEWVIYSTAYMAVNQLLLFTHGKTIMLGKPCYDFKSLIKTPVIIAIMLGTVWFVTGIRFPSPVQQGIANMGSMVGGASMLVAGMRIGGMDLRRIREYKRIWIVLVFRLLIIPLIAIPVLKLAGLISSAETVQNALLIVFMAASAPAASSVVNLAVLYDREADYASMINAVTVLSCVITMPLMVMLYQMI